MLYKKFGPKDEAYAELKRKYEEARSYAKRCREETKKFLEQWRVNEVPSLEYLELPEIEIDFVNFMEGVSSKREASEMVEAAVKKFNYEWKNGDAVRKQAQHQWLENICKNAPRGTRMVVVKLKRYRIEFQAVQDVVDESIANSKFFAINRCFGGIEILGFPVNHNWQNEGLSRDLVFGPEMADIQYII